MVDAVSIFTCTHTISNQTAASLYTAPSISPFRAPPLSLPPALHLQLVSAVPGLFALTKKRRLPTTLAAAYGEAAWQLVPRSFSLPGDIAAWRLWLDERAAAGENPGPWMLKTAQHLGRGLTLLPGEAAHAAALAPRSVNGRGRVAQPAQSVACMHAVSKRPVTSPAFSWHSLPPLLHCIALLLPLITPHSTSPRLLH